MKSAGTIEGGDGYWYAYDPSVEGTNSSGFSGLPGGFRNFAGNYPNMGLSGPWWSSTQFESNNALYRNLYYDATYVYRLGWYIGEGFSVRCLRD